MTRSYSLFPILLSLCLTITPQIHAKQKEEGYKSLAQIEAALDPLEFLANHDGIRRGIDLNIQFAFNSAEILPAAERQIDAIGKAITGKKLHGCSVLFTGHTDATGSEEANMLLSKQRANAVRQVMIEQYKVSKEMVLSEGKGETELLEKLAANNAKHRRVTISLVDAEKCKKQALKNEKSIKKEKDGQLKIDW